MDKLKDALNKPQVFWITSGLIAVLSLVCWFLGAGGVYKDAKAGAANVAKHFKMVHVVGQGGEDHPNPKWLELKDASIEKQKEAVREPWDAFFNSQQDTVFVWPTDKLSPEFIDAVKALDLDKDPKKEKEGLKPPLRDEYLNAVDKWFPELAERVAFGLKEGEKPGENDLPKVAWKEAKADGNVRESPMVNAINLRHFKWTERPSTERIRIAQEDYWVLKALCEIIIAVNNGEEEDDRRNPVVKTIESLDIANSVSLIASFPRSTTKGRFTLYGMVAKKGTVKKTAARGRAKAAAKMTEIDRLMDNRYVDEKGVGVPYTVYNSKSKKEPFQEYRLMPILMTLSVDKSKILRLLGAFANSDLPIEVQQVRFNPTKAGAKKDNAFNKDKSTRYGRFQIFAVAYLIKDVNYPYLELKEDPRAEAAVAGTGRDDAKSATSGS
jgi:hypothetical protein